MKIRRTISQFCGHPLLETMLFLGLAFLVLSFAIYFWQQIVGTLPSKAEWNRMLENMDSVMRPNHGPWHASFEGLLVLYPYLVLIPSTCVLGILLAAGKRSLILLVHSLAICFVLLLIAIFQLWHFAWVID